MSKRKKTTKKVAKKTNVIMHTGKQKPIWESAGSLMAGREDAKTEIASRMLHLATQVYSVPPQGVTILANQPYINKVGWKVKMHEYFGNNYRIKTKWNHMATPDEQYAIVEAIVEVKDKEGWEERARAIGEATPANIKLQAVKMTLNMMAETRAKNRAMFDIAGARTMEDAVTNIERMKKANKITSQQAEVIAEGAKVTAEEMNEKETKTIDKPEKSFSYMEKVKVEVHKRGAKNAREAIEYINRVAGLELASLNEISETQARTILPIIINQKIK